MSLLLLLRPLGTVAPPDVAWPLATANYPRDRRTDVSRFSIGQGDLLPVLDATLKDNAGTASEAAVNLTTAVSVSFMMRPVGSTTATPLTGTASITTAASGLVRYTWAGSDTATAGVYEAQWEVTWPSSKKMTFPSKGYDTVVITDDIA